MSLDMIAGLASPVEAEERAGTGAEASAFRVPYPVLGLRGILRFFLLLVMLLCFRLLGNHAFPASVDWLPCVCSFFREASG